MGGKTWSKAEEKVFWTEIVPYSPRRVNADRANDELSWNALSQKMKSIMAGIDPVERRNYTDLCLLEHYFQNACSERISPNAGDYPRIYILAERTGKKSGHSLDLGKARGRRQKKKETRKANAESAKAESSKSAKGKEREVVQQTDQQPVSSSGSGHQSSSSSRSGQQSSSSSRPGRNTAMNPAEFLDRVACRIAGMPADYIARARRPSAQSTAQGAAQGAAQGRAQVSGTPSAQLSALPGAQVSDLRAEVSPLHISEAPSPQAYGIIPHPAYDHTARQTSVQEFGQAHGRVPTLEPNPYNTVPGMVSYNHHPTTFTHWPQLPYRGGSPPRHFGSHGPTPRQNE